MKLLLFKAKRALVGTIRHRKAGTFVKTGANHWAMLKEIVNKKLVAGGYHPNITEARLMRGAAMKLVRHMVQRKGPFNRTIANKFLDSQYGYLGYRKFGEWKRTTIDSAEKYLKHMDALYAGDNVPNAEKTFTAVKVWREKLEQATSLLKSDVERDAWVANQFKSHRKPIGHILYAAREIIGRDTHLSMVPEKGFKGLCKSIIEKAYEHGPTQFDRAMLERFNKAFKTFFEKASSGTKKTVPLARALVNHAQDKSLYKQHPKWFIYCCTRLAAKNDGMVDLTAVESYMQNSMRYHGSKTPPPVDYDDPSGSMRAQFRLGLLGKKKMSIGRKKSKIPKLKRTFFKIKRRRKA